MKKRRILSAILFLIFWRTPLLSNNADIFRYEDKIMKNFYNGDYFMLYNSIETLLFRYPVHPLSVLHYRDLSRLTDIYGASRVENTLKKLIGKMGAGKVDNLCRLQLLVELEKLLYLSKQKSAERVTRKIRPVRVWRLSGPYNRYGKGDLKYQFTPEIISDARGLKKSVKEVFVKNPAGYLKTSRYLYPFYGIIYAFTSFHTTKPVIVRIYSKERYSVFVNGKKVITNRGENYRNLQLLKLSGTEKFTIMLKLESSNNSRFRMIITDENNIPMKLTFKNDVQYMNEFKYLVVNDYPYNTILSEMKKVKKANRNSKENLYRYYRYLGAFFNEHESSKGEEFFRESLKLKDDPVTGYFLASSMIDNRGGIRSSSRYLEGWRLIDKMSKKHENFGPLLHRRFTRLFDSSNYLKAYRMGTGLMKRFSHYPDIYINYLDLLNYLGYEKEYLDVLDKFKNKFKRSVYPLEAEAEYWKKRDRSRYRKILKRIVTINRSSRFLKKLIEASIADGKFKEALNTIKKYDHEEDFFLKKADILIEMGEYRKAKSLLFGDIVKNNRPSLYHRLGGIEYLEERDPLMFWEKMLSLNPSLFRHSDYNRFIINGYYTNPFGEYYPEIQKRRFRIEDLSKLTQPVMKKLKKYPSTILKRERIFILNDDRSSRVFCRDMVYLNNQKGIEKWGEYRIPYKGKVEPVRIRVYHTDGTFADSYQIHDINEKRSITLSSLKKDSVVEISYIIENPVRSPSGSHLFVLPLEFLQDFEEPVVNTVLRVITPEDIHINFLLSDKWDVNVKSVSGKKIYSVNISNLDAVYRESYTGSNQNLLKYFSFSSLKDREDFLHWYRGLLGNCDRLNKGGELKSLKGKSIKETVDNVYNFVSREISLKPGLLFYPENADDILYRKSGTVEDKVILSKAILKKLGIKSYIAFTGRRYHPDYGDFVNPDMFTDILLYVPIKVDSSLWLDYSNMYYSAGSVNHNISGTQSLVLLENSYLMKKVEGKKPGKFSSSYTIKLDESGNGEFGITSEFSGTYGSVRKYFAHRMYNEDVINNYLSSLIPHVTLNRYDVSGMDDYSRPFKIKAEGDGLGLAITGAGRLYLHPVLNKSGIYKYILKRNRNHPLFILTNINENEIYRYILPDSYSKSIVSKAFSARNSFGFAELSIKKESDSNELIVKKRIKIHRYRIDPDEYESFLEFCLKLKKAEFQTLIIKNNRK
jgi:hypothetical protein